MRFSVTIGIESAAAAVWDVLQDIERWPAWTPTMTSVERLDEGPLAVGSRARIRQPRLPAATWTITRLEPAHGFTWESRRPLVRLIADHWIEPDPTGCRVTLSVTFAGLLGSLVGELTRSIAVDHIGREARGLKARVEQTPRLP